MATTIQSVKGIVALVTGGGSGLGRGVVDRLLQQGAKGVVAMDTRFSENQPITNLVSVTGNVTSDEDVLRTLDEVQKHFGRLDVLVNCAGIGLARRVYDFRRKIPHPLDEYRRVLEVNALGTLNVTRWAVGLIGQNELENTLRGVVINTASVAAYEGQIGQVAYSASKGAIIGMTLPLARDLAPQGIRVMTIAPGLFDTPLLGSLPETVRKNLASTIPCPQRLGKWLCCVNELI